MRGSLALKLRVLRAERALTIEQAAERAGVTPETISDAERGRRHPYLPTLRKLAKAYDVPVEELLSAEEEQKEKEEPVLAPLDEASSPRPAVVAGGATREEAAEKLEQQLYAPARIAQGWHRLAQRWEERLERGDFDARSLEDFIDTLEDVALGMEANVAAEKKELRARYDDEDAVRSKAVLRPAIDRLSALVGEALQKIDREQLEVKAESEGKLTRLKHSFKRAS